MKITKEQIKQAYENPEKLKELFPDAFEIEHEVGKWYKGVRSLFCVTSVNKYGNLYGYGFFGGIFENYTDKNGVLCACNIHSKKQLKEAIPKKVEQALINEAKKRGLIDIGDISIKNIDDKIREKGYYATIHNYYNYYADADVLKLDCVTIYEKGKWAEVIEEPKTLPDGFYLGKMTGYEVNVQYNRETYISTSKIGTGGFGVPVIVEIKNGNQIINFLNN